MNWKDRVARAQAALRETDNDLMIICDRENLMYFTGLVEIECGGLIIPREGDPVLVTLWMDLPFFRKLTDIPVIGYMYRRETLALKMAEWINTHGYHAPKAMFTKYFIEVGVYNTLRTQVEGLQFVDGGAFYYRLRAVKDQEELGCIRQASAIVVAGMQAAIDALKPGITEAAVLGEAERAMRLNGSEGHPFRMQVLDESRQMMVHPMATSLTLHDNQYVVIHLGASVHGYVSKMCRSVELGQVDPKRKALYQLIVQAQKAAIAAARPGAVASEPYDAAIQVLATQGMDKYLIDDIGYGIGLRQSEFCPILGKARPDILENGMAVDLMFPTVIHPQHGGTRIADVVFVGETPEIITQFEDFPVAKR